MIEKKFEKIVKWREIKECYKCLSAMVVLNFIFVITFGFYLTRINPEWAYTFFPIGGLLIYLIISIIIGARFTYKKEVYWRYKR